MGAQPDLFGGGPEKRPVEPVKAPEVRSHQPKPLEPPRPKPTPASGRPAGKGDHVCAACGCLAVYGQGNTWFCRSCVPADFLPKPHLWVPRENAASYCVRCQVERGTAQAGSSCRGTAE